MRSCVPATLDTHAIAVSPRPSWLRRWTKTDYERGGEPSSRWEHRRRHRPIREGFRPLQTVAARAAVGRHGCQASASERKGNINSLVPADAGLCVKTKRIAVLRRRSVSTFEGAEHPHTLPRKATKPTWTRRNTAARRECFKLFAVANDEKHHRPRHGKASVALAQRPVLQRVRRTTTNHSESPSIVAARLLGAFARRAEGAVVWGSINRQRGASPGQGWNALGPAPAQGHAWRR